MTAEEKAEIFAGRLANPAIDLKTKVTVAIELRDSIDYLAQAPIYANFLKQLMPVFLTLLDGPPEFQSAHPKHKLRSCLLETLHRLPNNPPDALEPYAVNMVEALMALVRVENEENAVLIMKIIMDFQRNQHQVLQSKVQPFLNLIHEIFDMTEKAVKDTFDVPAQGIAAGHPSTPSNAANFQSPRPSSPTASAAVTELGEQQVVNRRLQPGMTSFKVLAECPIIVVSLFQKNSSVVKKNVTIFVPLIKNVLLLQAKPQEQAHEEAASRNDIFAGVSSLIRNRAAFGDFITAQVKTMSFLAYLLRVYANQLQDFLPTLPSIVVRLLQDCPREKSSARKELLVAIRHIINFNFRKIFLPKIDDLLDERTLIGDGLTVFETMRPLAYSMLADLIHHVRNALKPEQIKRTVEVYTRNLHDQFPGTSFQTMSAKLLLNMADCIADLPKEDARHYLMMILDAIGDKFAAMSQELPNAAKLAKPFAQQNPDINRENYLADKDLPPDWDETDIFTSTPIKTSNPRDRSADPVAENKFLFKNLVNGLKNIFYQLKECNPSSNDQPIDLASAPSNWEKDVSFGFSAEDVRIITKLFHEGASVFRYYQLEKPPPDSHSASTVELLANHYMVNSSKEEKELLEGFATIFVCIDPATFHEVFRSEIPKLYEMMFEHPALLHIPQFFLACEVTSPSFAGMLLQFLAERIEDVGSEEPINSSILLRLFKLSFMAVTLFPDQNEQVVLPHVTKLVTKSIQLSTTAKEPMSYFLLLRSLFRSIGGGRFEDLYKDILPLLEMLLEVLNNLLLAARNITERNLYVELCLTVPARLSNLLPHLNYLMRPLVIALGASADLVGQGLRTLELCVDNLTADYLDPIMAPVMDELMAALWKHLKPAPYTHFHAHATMRILGKLGGRNRKFLTAPPQLSFKQFTDDSCSVDIKLIGSGKERAFPIELGVDLAIGKLMETPKTSNTKKADEYYKRQALHLVSSQLKLFIGADSLPDDFAQLVRLQANDLVEANHDFVSDLLDRSDRDKSTVKKEAQEVTLQKLLKAVIFAMSIPELAEEASALVQNISRHFVILEIGRALADMKHEKMPFDVKSGEGLLFLNDRVLADALVECFASETEGVRKAAEAVVVTLYRSAATIFGDEKKVEKLPFFIHLAKAFCHSCYNQEWFTKAGGRQGIHVFCTTVDLGDSWMASRQTDFIRALLFVMKDMPQDLPAKTRLAAQETLELLLRRCNKPSPAGEERPNSRMVNLCGYLIYELAHMNKHVRHAAQRAFNILAETSGTEVHTLMAPVKDRLLSPIYNKPLRALPFAVQIGYIDAITYCLGLQQGLVEFNDQLNRLLNESLGLADAENEQLAPRPNEQRTAEHIVNLRVACIRLLSTAMGFPEFGASAAQSTSRPRIISVFFKSLYAKNIEVIEVANLGLKAVLSTTNKLPKDLLQHGLRPILMNLQDPKRLSVAGLDGLARLLALLTNYFKVEIGARLLDHMKTFSEMSILQKVSFSLIEESQPMKIVAAILNIFHLLPPAAITFMPRLIDSVLDLERDLRRTHYSPFREPLFKYLNRHAKETWEYFSKRLGVRKYGRFFSQVLLDPTCEPVREVVMADVEGLNKLSLDVKDVNAGSVATVNTIQIVHSLSRHESSKEWLLAQDTLRHRLMTAGRQLQQKLRQSTNTKQLIKNDLRLSAEQSRDLIIEIFIAYLSQAPQDLDFLFEIIDAVTAQELKSTRSLIRHIYTTIISSDSIDYWRTIVTRCLDLYGKPTCSQRTKTFAFHYLVNPILAMDLMKHPPTSLGGQKSAPRLMDKALTDMMHQKIWKANVVDSNDSGDDPAQIGIDHSRMELLQMTALAIKYHHDLLTELRKEVIKFAWTFIRLEDIINKQAAYVVTAYFIAHFDVPPKMAIQIYVALLRAHQNEGRSLVAQALELIADNIPKRLASSNSESRAALWAKWPRRILSEDSSNLQQLMSIAKYLVRHPDLFYDSREQFVPLLITSLPKIAVPPTPSNEQRRLSLNVIALIWKWEKRRVPGGQLSPRGGMNESPMSRKRKLELMQDVVASPASPSPAVTSESQYKISDSLRMSMIKYLVSFISQLSERYSVPSGKTKEISQATVPVSTGPQAIMIKEALKLLQDLLSPGYWDDLDVDISMKIIEQRLVSDKIEKADDRIITHVMNMLQVVRIILNFKSDEWIVNHLTILQKLLDRSLRSENAEIQDCLHTQVLSDEVLSTKPIIKRILDALPELNSEEEDADDTENPAYEFVSFLSVIATKTLSESNHNSGINILWSLSHQRPSEIDQHIPAVMKALSTKIARDLVAAHNAAVIPGPKQPLRPGDPASAALRDPTETKIQTDLTLKTIDLISRRMSALGDQRRPFLSVLASLAEKSQSSDVCLKVLDMVQGWIFDSSEPFPTLKEKTAVLHKMLSFENNEKLDQKLLAKFFDLVIRIYEDPKVTRTELTVRLEQAFLIGTRAQDVETRNRFLATFDRSITRTTSARLYYLLASQHWDVLAESFWLSQVIHLMFGSIEMNHQINLHSDDSKVLLASVLFASHSKDPRKYDLLLEDSYEDFILKHRRFCAELADVKARDIFEPLAQLQHLSPQVAHEIWISLFPLCWSTLQKEEKIELEVGMVDLLTKDHHHRQADERPNVVQTLVDGAAKAKPTLKIPPHLLKFMSRTYNVWYTSACILEGLAIKPVVDTPVVRESTLDALVELYAGLQEDDLFYGTWRRRCQFVETNAALSYEQHGIWEKAQHMYEAAQIEARTAAIPFSQSEYMLWEDHWMICAQKLQQWDILHDLAKHENFNDLLLECAWRHTEMWQGDNREQLDQVIKSLMDAPTPRRSFFQAFIALLKLHGKSDTTSEFNRLCDESIQLSIRKWHQLPASITNAHIPILQNFQQLVELHDASVISSSLSSTNQSNLDTKSQELKLLLGTWRDRLPNEWDDINAWQDLVTWRQHIFHIVNATYLQLQPPTQSGASTSSFAYRGYHETAWIINRFAHVARKHQLQEVCIAQLSRIYTLPNIEIQEAFLKLREQAKCHYQNPKELTNGLDVINNTNLSYFGAQQKAEFFTLKGMFLAKAKNHEGADEAFGTALYYDLKLPKAWAEWGRWNDNLFKEDPTNISIAANAVQCYLEAASLYKNAKSRKLLSRILWLLSLDDADGNIAKAFTNVKSETPVWYWITFIPQLLSSLQHREARVTKDLLHKIAKAHPQALYFLLRTNREELLQSKKQQEQKEKARRPAQNSPQHKPNTPSAGQQAAAVKQEGAPKPVSNGASASPKSDANGQAPSLTGDSAKSGSTPTRKHPWEYTEEIMAVLKTAYPLLSLSMETMVDQIQKHFKCPPDEDAYRLIVALLNDGLSYVGRMPTSYAQDVKLPPATELNITRFAETILPAHIRKSFEADFVAKKPTMFEYIQKLRKWRDKFEEKLDRRASRQSLETYSPHLSEFRFQKFDNVDVPGQYLQHRDKQTDFIRIERFLPDVELVRGIGNCHRRIKIRGHDGSIHPFAVQHPAARHSRREERILQLFRIFNGILVKRKESRRRNLSFHLPLMIPLAPHIRLVEDDPSYVSLQGVFEDHCRRNGMNKDDPLLFTMEKLRALTDTKSNKYAEVSAAVRFEAFTAIQEKYVPQTLALEYFQATYPAFSDFWLFRRQFSYQFASLTFLTYIMHMNNRFPHKLSISRGTGNVWGAELIPAMAAGKAFFHNPEPVPFRLTPNLQCLMGPIATEGIFGAAIMAIARCLTQKEFTLEQHLSLFVRDEMLFWFTQQHRGATAQDLTIRDNVIQNSEYIVKKAVSLAQPPQGKLPANQTVIDLISKAVNPQNLAQSDALWMPYL
ncbi:MAG: hypothetical protein M1814_002934 [Vezdaea aestivalis]|nr:MAG: hypothetical protein M1814_002934 [Vezdaea aestivalis]